MSISENNKIDAIGTDKVTGDIILTIADHLDWTDSNMHLNILQEKLNAYIQFIESGQIFDDYPNCRGRKLIIEIVSKEDYTGLGLNFLQKVRPIIQSIGVGLNQRVFKE